MATFSLSLNFFSTNSPGRCVPGWLRAVERLRRVDCFRANVLVDSRSKQSAPKFDVPDLAVATCSIVMEVEDGHVAVEIVETHFG